MKTSTAKKVSLTGGSPEADNSYTMATSNHHVACYQLFLDDIFTLQANVRLKVSSQL